jgi:hypothetical protein
MTEIFRSLDEAAYGSALGIAEEKRPRLSLCSAGVSGADSREDGEGSAGSVHGDDGMANRQCM